MTVVRPLARHKLGRVGEALPLHRFADWRDDSTYLIAWEDATPVGQAHVAWGETELGVPELQEFLRAGRAPKPWDRHCARPRGRRS